MASLLLTAKKDSKRSRILEAAKRRFGRFGIKATTMLDIAREADIGSHAKLIAGARNFRYSEVSPYMSKKPNYAAGRP